MRYVLFSLSILIVACGPSSGGGTSSGGGDATGGSSGAGSSGGGTGGNGGTGGATPTPTLVWQEVKSSQPSRRMSSAMAYDEKRGVIMLYGGIGCVNIDCSSTTDLEDLWEWDGSAWKESPKAGVWPGPTSEHAMAYDPSREKVIIHGGDTTSLMGWDGAAWTEIQNTCFSGCPFPRKDHAMAFHPGRGHLVVYSGISGFETKADSYELVGNDWQPIGGATHPDGRVGAQLAYDPNENVMWLFGGSNGYAGGLDGYPNDVWKLDASGWTRVNEGGSALEGSLPWGRRQAMFIWHPAIQKSVLFGGYSYPAAQFVGGLDSHAALGVWTWDGKVWQKRPDWYFEQAFRSDQTAAPFPATKQIVQFGGSYDVTFPDDMMYLFGPSLL